MIDMTDLKKVKSAIKPNTKIVWIETPTNPTLKCTDIAGVAKICKEKGVLLAIDNTFMSPVLQVSFHSIRVKYYEFKKISNDEEFCLLVLNLDFILTIFKPNI